MSQRKLASVRRITEINPIPDADRIVQVMVDGWSIVTQKSNNLNVNDVVVYFEIDSFLPVTEKFEFLRPNCFKSTSNLGDGFRIRTIKLKKTLSQGLILPWQEFFTEIPEEGTDLTEILGVQKYEKPIPSYLTGKVKGNFPGFVPKTDQERVQNLRRNVETWTKEQIQFEITEKLDGSSMTVYTNNGVFGVCSRNFDLEETEDNAFWRTARNLSLEQYVPEGYAFQGELVGPGVQGNKYGLTNLDYYIFDIWDITNRRYLGYEERNKLLEGKSLKQVPYISTSTLFGLEIKNILEMAEGKSMIGNHSEREGIVFKSKDGNNSFKAISNKWLLKNEENS